MTPINTDQKKKRELKSVPICAICGLKNKRMMRKVHVNFERLGKKPDLYSDDLVNARSRAGTSEKHLHLATSPACMTTLNVAKEVKLLHSTVNQSIGIELGSINLGEILKRLEKSTRIKM